MTAHFATYKFCYKFLFISTVSLLYYIYVLVMALNKVTANLFKYPTIWNSEHSCSHFHTSFGNLRIQVAGYNINVPRLSPNEVTTALRANEYSHEFSSGPVKSYDTNQLASNNPIEDTRAEVLCKISNGVFAGIFDGHAGASCAQVVAKRLFHYMLAASLPPEKLGSLSSSFSEDNQLLEWYNNKYDFVDQLKRVYSNSLLRYIADLQAEGKVRETKEALEHSFLRLDSDLSHEATSTGDRKTVAVAMSGCVACVAVIEGSSLHVASTGDAGAVLGVLSENGKCWTARKLSVEHNTDNRTEVERILSEHPVEEKHHVLERERLLGQLAPLRAFGDFRYKWSKEMLEKLAVPLFGNEVIAPHYETPPYLTCKPDITYRRLTPRDKFLVIASDGLWDLLSPLQVVRMVGEHMSGKAALSPLRLPRDVKLRDVFKILSARRQGLDKVPIDRNAATHLIRNALGGTEYGEVEHAKVSQLLSLPQDVVRLFRDDITVTVIYFDSDFITHCPM